MPPEKTGAYRSFLLRCWQEQNADQDKPPLWRFALQEVAEEQRQHAFSSFEQLVDFLRNEVVADEEVE